MQTRFEPKSPFDQLCGPGHLMPADLKELGKLFNAAIKRADLTSCLALLKQSIGLIKWEATATHSDPGFSATVGDYLVEVYRGIARREHSNSSNHWVLYVGKLGVSPFEVSFFEPLDDHFNKIGAIRHLFGLLAESSSLDTISTSPSQNFVDFRAALQMISEQGPEAFVRKVKWRGEDRRSNWQGPKSWEGTFGTVSVAISYQGGEDQPTAAREVLCKHAALMVSSQELGQIVRIEKLPTSLFDLALSLREVAMPLRYTRGQATDREVYGYLRKEFGDSCRGKGAGITQELFGKLERDRSEARFANLWVAICREINVSAIDCDMFNTFYKVMRDISRFASSGAGACSFSERREPMDLVQRLFNSTTPEAQEMKTLLGVPEDLSLGMVARSTGIGGPILLEVRFDLGARNSRRPHKVRSPGNSRQGRSPKS